MSIYDEGSGSLSEYFMVETETTENPDVLLIIASETLTDGEIETYANTSEGDEGSPIAQMLFHGVMGIEALIIQNDTLTITRNPDVPWEMIIDETRDALRDFFL